MITGALGAVALLAVGSAATVGGLYYLLHRDQPAVLTPEERPAEADGAPSATPSPREARRNARSEEAGARQAEQMAQPDAKYAGQLVSPLVSMRRRLQSFGPEGDALGKPSDAIVGDLRENHRDPNAHPWPELVAQIRTLTDAIRASQWATDPTIQANLERIDRIEAEHDAAAAGAPVEEAPEGGG